MENKTWLAPAIYGGIFGAIALAIIGFSWGGWVTGGTANKMAEQAAEAAVVAAMMPYCLARSKDDPGAAEILSQLNKANGYNRRGIVEEAGWATPLGAETPNRGLAIACEKALSAT
jgi:hypothetical protein